MGGCQNTHKTNLPRNLPREPEWRLQGVGIKRPPRRFNPCSSTPANLARRHTTDSVECCAPRCPMTLFLMACPSHARFWYTMVYSPLCSHLLLIYNRPSIKTALSHSFIAPICSALLPVPAQGNTAAFSPWDFPVGLIWFPPACGCSVLSCHRGAFSEPSNKVTLLLTTTSWFQDSRLVRGTIKMLSVANPPAIYPAQNCFNKGHHWGVFVLRLAAGRTCCQNTRITPEGRDRYAFGIIPWWHQDTLMYDIFDLSAILKVL